MFSRSSLNTEAPTWEKKIGQVISVTFNFVAELFSELHGVLLERSRMDSEFRSHYLGSLGALMNH